MELKFIEKKEKVIDGTRYERDTYSIGPYTVIVDKSFSQNGKEHRSITVAEPWPKNEEYIPHIYYRDNYFGRKVSVFEVQTTAFGTLDHEEFKKFIETQKMALEVIETLNREFDCKGLGN